MGGGWNVLANAFGFGRTGPLGKAASSSGLSGPRPSSGAVVGGKIVYKGPSKESMEDECTGGGELKTPPGVSAGLDLHILDKVGQEIESDEFFPGSSDRVGAPLGQGAGAAAVNALQERRLSKWNQESSGSHPDMMMDGRRASVARSVGVSHAEAGAEDQSTSREILDQLQNIFAMVRAMDRSIRLESRHQRDKIVRLEESVEQEQRSRREVIESAAIESKLLREEVRTLITHLTGTKRGIETVGSITLGGGA
ncbi:hypothetical protein HK104_001503 [Borealophlyctis nickersoniae]|nr:hypothetical protein HK104_001503 [Borealophlyctis nickersoniae]